MAAEADSTIKVSRKSTDLKGFQHLDMGYIDKTIFGKTNSKCLLRIYCRHFVLRVFIMRRKIRRILVAQMTLQMNASEIISLDTAIKCLSKGEHHFSACQIIITDVSIGSPPNLSLAKRPSASSFKTDTSGQIEYPTPRLRQFRRLFMLENSSLKDAKFCFSSDRSKGFR